MNYSAVKTSACTYLGFYGALDNASYDLLDGCLDEILKIHRFRHIEKYYGKAPEFLNKQPYTDYLSGAEGLYLCAMTLGAEVDIHVRRLMCTDMPRAVVCDACASALLEQLSDEYESKLAERVSYRFCSGYGGSSVEDIKPIFRELKPERIGMELLPSGLIAPQKSMVGIVAVGKDEKKSCRNCILLEKCQFRREGVTCYKSETK